ncbi:MAG: type II toxin-antitoxin system RelE/ParE family toxin [Clostridia bacterium]
MVIWTDRAKKHLTNFIDNAYKDTPLAKTYILKLVDYANMLENMKYLGVKLNIYKDNENIRQLIYKSHRIIYMIQEEQVYIVAVLNTKMDFKSMVNEYFD